MPASLDRHWNRVKAWFADEADHVTVEFFEEPGAEPLEPYRSYLRLWLAEGFLASSANWGSKLFPVLHGGVALDFLGGVPRTPPSLGPRRSGAYPASSWTSG